MSIHEQQQEEEEIKFSKIKRVFNNTFKVLLNTPIRFTFYFFLILTFIALFFGKEFSFEYYLILALVGLGYVVNELRLWQLKDSD